jgi:hypothetical protein
MEEKMFILIKRTKFNTFDDRYDVVETAKTLESARMKKNALKILAKDNESFTIIQFAEEKKQTFVDNIKQLKFPFVEAR